jgi:electron transport complex protein RnfC
MHGGLHLLAHKQRSTIASIATASIPARLTLTLRSNGHDQETFVAAGERILLGQLLARSHDKLLHASTSGTVVAVEQTADVCIVIDTDGNDSPHESIRPIENYQQLTSEQLRERIAQGGIVGLGGACFPTATKLKAAARHHTRLLIVNGAECEPYISCDDALMREHASDIVFGAQVLMHAAGATRAVLAVENDKPEAIAAISQALDQSRDARLRLEVIGSYYPAGGERQLVKAIVNCEVPSGGMTSDIGVLCQNVGTAAAIARLVTTGESLTNRIVTVTGHGVKEPRNLRARFGTSFASLIDDCGGYVGRVERLVMGGSMMGVALTSDAMSVSAATNCIIAATANDFAQRGPEMPCIRCGDCTDACPAELLPQQLLRYARLNDRAALDELGLRDCIECGCCDYVCPSQIPITEQLRLAKAATF